MWCGVVRFAHLKGSYPRGICPHICDALPPRIKRHCVTVRASLVAIRVVLASLIVKLAEVAATITSG